MQDLKDNKEQFLNNENKNDDFESDSESESDSGKTRKIELTLPANKKKNGSNEIILMNSILQYQNLYLKSQKKIFKLKNEIDKEEVISRYTKLELNNALLDKEKFNNQIIALKLELKKKNYNFNAVCVILFLCVCLFFQVTVLNR